MWVHGQRGLLLTRLFEFPLHDVTCQRMESRRHNDSWLCGFVLLLRALHSKIPASSVEPFRFSFNVHFKVRS